MGPERAVNIMKSRYTQADAFRVTLYGSLASTGVGHGTDRVIRETFAPIPCEVLFDHTTPCPIHPNTMDIEVLCGGEVVDTKRIYSVGGGSIEIEGEVTASLSQDMRDDVYELNTYAEIADYCHKNNLRIWQYVEEREGKEIFDYLSVAWEQMKRTIHEGLTTTGVLPGVLGTQRRAQILYNQKHKRTQEVGNRSCKSSNSHTELRLFEVIEIYLNRLCPTKSYKRNQCCTYRVNMRQRIKG
jgi:L-serine dehydratase